MDFIGFFLTVKVHTFIKLWHCNDMFSLKLMKLAVRVTQEKVPVLMKSAVGEKF